MLLGRIVDPETKAGIEGVRVDVWDKVKETVVAVVWTDEEGSFRAGIPELPVLRTTTQPITATEPNVAIGDRYELRLSEDVVAAKAESISARADRLEALLSGKRKRVSDHPIVINSFAELEAKEEEIVARVNGLPSGGQLFLIHPFMTLAEVGVIVGREARAEIVAHEPKLRALSPIPFHALRSSKAKQNIRVRIRGLFKPRSA